MALGRGENALSTVRYWMCFHSIFLLFLISYYVCMYGHTYSKSMDQPGKVVNPARGQLNREN